MKNKYTRIKYCNTSSQPCIVSNWVLFRSSCKEISWGYKVTSWLSLMLLLLKLMNTCAETQTYRGFVPKPRWIVQGRPIDSPPGAIGNARRGGHVRVRRLDVSAHAAVTVSGGRIENGTSRPHMLQVFPLGRALLIVFKVFSTLENQLLQRSVPPNVF